MPETLDIIDRKIIYTLDFDSRMPLSQLAKKVGISKQVAKYRLENLQKKGVIMGFNTDISLSRIGYEAYIVYFKFNRMTPDIEKQFIQHMTHQEAIGVNISVNGKWDYSIVIWARNVVDFKRVYLRAMKDYEKYVKEKDVMIETDFYYFKPTQILDQKSDRQITMTGEIEAVPMDRKDHMILRELAKDARTPLVNLGTISGLTPNAVKERIKRPEKEGVIIGYRVSLNYQLLGFLHYRVFLHLENITEEVERQIIQYLKYDKTCVSITKTIGYCELEFRPIVKDVSEFYQLMEGIRNKFGDVLKDYESIIYSKMHGAWNYYPFSE